MQRLITIIFLFYSHLSLSNVVTLSEHGAYSLAPHVSYFIAHKENQEFTEVLKNDKDIDWIKNSKHDINFGFGDGVYWFKTQLYNNNQFVHDWALEFSYAQLDQLEIYLLHNNALLQYQLGGDTVPYQDKSIEHPHTVFPLHLIPAEKYDLYIRVEGSGSIQIPMMLWEWDHFNKNTLSHFMIQGLFFGFVIIMTLYNLMVWITKRREIYLHYFIYILSFAIFQSSLNGIGFQFFWPNLPFLNNYITVFSLSISLASFNYFVNYFFNMEDTSKKISKTLIRIFYSYLVFSIVSMFLPYYYATLGITILATLNIGLIFFISLYMLKIKHVSSRYFVLAWSGFLIGGTLLSLNKIGLISINYISEYALQVGVAIEVIVLSLALADKMSRSIKESLALANQVNEAQESTFQAQLENLKLDIKNHQELESIVEDRTKKLTQALEHLSIAHDKLQTISITDALTELHNRYYFNEHFKIEYKRAFREKSECSLIMLDVDHFKAVNDTYGHPAGDVCLKYIADCIKAGVARSSDICCRYGGEEFVIILPATPLLAAYDLADDIRQNIQRQPVLWEDIKIDLTASFGVSSVIPVKSDDKHRQYLINQADQALYQAKNLGRNTVVMFEPDIL